ncbi:cation-translocating P-type ATPase [Rhodococcus sp. D2-41]|uniref:cation-translocating P-type ATPase n=1 Tax=Speluncibacter jeojiensis TaxID=2710754 RepID=UPI00240F7C6A|nr:cation-translocating P-type ATPase [Rhodococcus sp. D2-41]MDG3010401.1 cation-translocating P-type ATPase [Rhodococcus sp. D2-41]
MGPLGMSTALSSFAAIGSTAVRAGFTATAIGAGTVMALTDPAVHAGRSAFDGARTLVGQGPALAWSARGRLHLDLEPMVPFHQLSRHTADIEDAVRALPGVTVAHVEGTLGRIVVEHESGLDVEEVRRAIREATTRLRQGPAALAPADREADERARAALRAAKRAVPVADPGDLLAIVVPAVIAALDVAAVAVSLATGFGRVPAAPRAARAAAAVVHHQPRVVAALESRLGRVGTDVVLATMSAATNGFGRAPAAPMLDLVQRVAQISEARAHRHTWAGRERDLASAARPQAPVVPITSSAIEDLDEPRHSWAAAAAGEISHVVVDAAVDVAVDSAKGASGGVVEEYTEQAASGSLLAAAGALIASGHLHDVADSILAGVPKAAHVGRGMFAAILGRGLARSGQLVLDPGALRRLDRVKVVVIDGAALRGDARAVLRTEASAPGWDDDRVYEVADALLHREPPPAAGPEEPDADRPELHWRKRSSAPSTPAEGLERADLVCAGEVVGTVMVGWELDQFAAPLIETARRSGTRVVLRHVAGTEDLAASVSETHPAGTPLLQVVRELRKDRGPVLLVTSLHPDFASADTLAALAISDIGVALDDSSAATPWTADVLTGSDLSAAVRIISALPAARRASATAVRLAKGGTTLAGLLLVTGESGSRGAVGLGRWLSPVNAAAAMAMLSGALAAVEVLRRPDPDPQLLTAWHALDPDIVYARLTEQAQPLTAPAGQGFWRRVQTDLSDSVVAAPLLDPARNLGRLLAATRRELSDPLTPVLAVGVAASAILGSSIDALLVGGVMVVNAFVGGAQRVRADNAAAELFATQDQRARRVVVPIIGGTRRRLSVARTTERVVTVSAARLHPGDVVDLRANEVVPADARLLLVEDLEVDESSLTGESVPVSKQVDPVSVTESEDRASMVFEGSTVVAGRGRAIVVATGTGTAAHRAIWAASGIGPAPGIQARLHELTSKVLPLVLAGGAGVTGLSLLRRRPLRQAIADGVAIAVAAVPEGLPLVATIAQLASARRLSHQGVLVRTPRTLEALGRVDTVCFDKTGTLTENRLRVVTVARYPDGATGDAAATVLRAAARACPRPKAEESHAHATDEAVITAAGAAAETADTWQLLDEVPFESSRGYAAALGMHTDRDGSRKMLVLKGAPEVLHPRCRFDDPDGPARAEALVHELADQGLRVIAVARVPVEPHARSVDGDADEFGADGLAETADDLELLGYVGLADTPRPSARPLLEQLTAAGRTAVLITGDHPVTARAIAWRLGLPDDVGVVTGEQLADCDEEARIGLVSSAQVFARVSPEQKMQVVTALQSAGRITAMVGDGANDAAAIRVADVGIGVTSRGSTAARGAADLVLTVDDLTTMLDAFVEGKNMWQSVRDALVILLGGNAGEVAFTVVGTALGGRAPLGTRQLLLVNLLTDMFPALAVAVTPHRPAPELVTDGASPEDIEQQRVEHRREALSEPAPSLGRPLVRDIVERGAVTTVGATAAWAIGRWTPGTYRRSATMGLAALVGTQLAQTLRGRTHSPLVVATAAGSIAVLVGIIQTPGVSQFFGCTPLGPVAWTGVFAATAGAGAVSVLAPRWLAGHTVGSAPEPASDPTPVPTGERTE